MRIITISTGIAISQKLYHAMLLETDEQINNTAKSTYNRSDWLCTDQNLVKFIP